MDTSRLITGILIILFGLWFVVALGFVDGPGFDAIAFIIGAIFIALGVWVIFNEKENQIEQIKSWRKQKK